MTNLTCVTVDAANLTEAQRDGLACPVWCDHERAHRAPVDVEHESGMHELASASLCEGDAFADVDVALYQQSGKPVRVALGIATHLGDATAELTPDEALQVAYGLINKAMAARAAGGCR
ncbi:DUF6907 domain-containing protein [Nonomuraea angiospora]|uniref:DUF6907 domain-containing protein n=1 Tax=Nonomuraea angiospora TaxID=46172 RepID=UPI0029B626EC|nr:hypothetical protein [Nonomuraea angiospora]MDX3099683.1 hypothetical protein [Nonomuraea angiospora]